MVLWECKNNSNLRRKCVRVLVYYLERIISKINIYKMIKENIFYNFVINEFF